MLSSYYNFKVFTHQFSVDDWEVHGPMHILIEFIIARRCATLLNVVRLRNSQWLLCCLLFSAYCVLGSESCRLLEFITLELTHITANNIRVRKEQKRLNVFLWFCFIFGRGYLPETIWKIVSYLPEPLLIFALTVLKDICQTMYRGQTVGGDRKINWCVWQIGS